MIKIERVSVMNLENAIRGARNPLNSWARMDSVYDENGNYILGPNDLDLARRLAKAGSDHRKFLRQIFVSVDITAPLYWWKEFDTYKVGTVANSCSTMHKIAAKEFELNDFSCEHLNEDVIKKPFKDIIDCLNFFRELYLQHKDKDDWWQMIQLLPSSYNQKRTKVMCVRLSEFSKIKHMHSVSTWSKQQNILATPKPLSCPLPPDLLS